MKTEYFKFYSSHIGREMELKVYGHRGKPMLVFPSSGGRFIEYEDFKIIEAVKDFIDQGLIQVYAVDSVDNESWLDNYKLPLERARRHNDYDRYIVDELVPFIKHHGGYQGGLIATGCSMGGYHSANFFFRHPDIFDTLIALSGIYDARFFVGENLHFQEVSLNSPVDYLKEIGNVYLELYRKNNIIVCTGQGAWEEDSVRDSQYLEWVLSNRGVGGWFDYWGYDVNHDWPWWRIQMPYFLGQLHSQGKL